MKKNEQQEPQKQIKFGGLAVESVPEIWMAHFITSIILFLLAFAFGQICNAIIGTKVAALTTANMKEVFSSWQGPVLIIIGVVFILFYAALDLFLRVHVTGNILRGEKAAIFGSMKRSILDIKRFLNPSGISILLYILFAVPLAGLGFSVGATQDFAIPKFIMDVIKNRTSFAIIYVVGIIALLVIGFFYIFSLHGVLLSGMTPKEAKSYSVKLIKKNWKKFVSTMILVILIAFGVRFGVNTCINLALKYGLDPMVGSLPIDYIDKDYSDPTVWLTLDEEDVQIMSYRVGCTEAVLEGGYVDLFLTLLGSSIIMLFFTKLYMEFDAAERGEEAPTWLSRPKGRAYTAKIVLMIAFAGAIAIISFVWATSADSYLKRREPAIFAHRSCGTLGVENSVEGLQLAVEHGCIGGEIDIQRTKDGYYVINHDNDFKRLTGVAKTSSEMTLAEIEELEIKDPSGSGKIYKVPKLEEFLVEAKRINAMLLLELKGDTADEQMADDVVAMVKEYGVEDQVIYISLKENVMNYMKEKYPETKVSSVFFAGIGNFANLPCDLLGLEEGMASPVIYAMAHSSGKTVDVWTPNTESSLRLFMDSDVDYITTDEVELAEKVRKELDSRTYRELIIDRLQDVWSL